MVADDSSVTPDVWVVEFGENFDASLDQYEALLAMVCVWRVLYHMYVLRPDRCTSKRAKRQPAQHPHQNTPQLMFDEARFGRPAVLTAAVAKNFCWWSEGGVRSTQCGLHRTMGWLEVRFKESDVSITFTWTDRPTESH